MLYSCSTPSCDGRALVVFYALALGVLFEAPLVDGYYTVPDLAAEWVNGARSALRQADINACIYAGQEPPAILELAPVPRMVGPAAFLTGLRTWRQHEVGEHVDLAELFAERVADERGRRA